MNIKAIITIDEFFKKNFNKRFKVGDRVLVHRKEFNAVYEKVDRRNWNETRTWKLIEKVKL